MYLVHVSKQLSLPTQISLAPGLQNKMFHHIDKPWSWWGGNNRRNQIETTILFIYFQLHCTYTWSLKLAVSIYLLTHYAKGMPLEWKVLNNEAQKRFYAISSFPLFRHSLLRPSIHCLHRISGFLLHSFLRFLSPFPHSTCTLLVTEEYLGLEGGSPWYVS